MDTVLFDMDGTLLDTIDDIHASVNLALREAGLPEVSRDETRLAAGYGAIALIEKLSHGACPAGSREFEQTYGAYARHYNLHHNDHTRPYDGIMELLAALRERGFKMAVVSNKGQEDTEQLRELFFADYISYAIGRTDSRPPKPAPDMAFAALELLGSTAAQAFYVGDSEPDAQIAKNAGCVGVSCLWGFRSRETLEAQQPAYLIEYPRQLLDIIDNLG